ncbi:MAG: hypothetical protein ACI4R8_01650 [Candidatus Caccovivens sp.]
MIQLKVKEIKTNGEYVLQEKDGQTQSLILEFYDITPPVVGDTLFVHRNLLNRSSKKFTQPFAFEPLSVENENQKVDDEEMIGLHTQNGDVVLKRIYG